MKKILLGTLYWIWSLTWGALMTIPGLLVTGFCILFLHGKPHKNGSYYGTSYWEEISAHEFGHSLWHQHLLMGPLFPFLVGIPSACRYWYQRIMQEKYHKQFPADWYNRFWAEADATKMGLKVKKWLGQVDKDYEIK